MTAARGAVKADTEVSRGIGDYEEALRQIREVAAVRVVTDSEGGIEEIHVLAGKGRSPKQIVRDVESTLLAQFGVPVDHKKISVAQVNNGPPQSWGQPRVRLLSVRFSTNTVAAEAEVKVELDDVVHTGRVSGAASSANRLRVAAEATLSAVGEHFNSRHYLSLDDVVVLELRARRICLVALSLLAPGGEEALIGTSLIRVSEADAAARAVLDALNRRFNFILRAPAGRRAAEEAERVTESDG